MIEYYGQWWKKGNLREGNLKSEVKLWFQENQKAILRKFYLE